MSLKLGINILKGWPNPYILEDSLKGAVALTQGNVVYRNTDNKWELWSGKAADIAPILPLSVSPYVVMVDSTDPSTGRGQYEGAADLNVHQMDVGAIHAISLSNPLEIQVASSVTFTIGQQISVSITGGVQSYKVAAAGELVIGVVSRGSYETSRCPVGAKFFHFVAENGKRAAA